MAGFSSIIIQPRLLRVDDAGQYVGCPGLLALMVKAGWIKAIVQRKRMTVYQRSKLDECCERLERGEFPEGD